jgi:ABC-type multidrug transport system fused ATPase/permease subunit
MQARTQRSDRGRAGRSSAVLSSSSLESSVPVVPDSELSFAAPAHLNSRDVFRLLSRAWPFIRPYKRHLIYLALLTLPGLVAGLLALTLIRIFFDVIGQGHPLKWYEARMLLVHLGAPREAVLWHACVFAGLAAIVAIPCGMAAFGYAVWILQRISNLFRVNLYTRLQELSLKFHAEEKIGDAMFRMFQDSAALPGIIDGLLLQPLMYVPLLIGTLGWLMLYNFWIALIAAAIIPLNLALAWLYSERLRRAFLSEREATAQVTTRLEETLASIKTVKAFGTEASETGIYAGDNWNAFLAARRARLMLARYSVLTNTIRALATVAAGYFGARQVINGGMGGITGAVFSLGVFEGEMAIIARMSNSTRNLTNLWGSMQDVVVAISRVLELLSRPTEAAIKSGHRVPHTHPQALYFDDVRFGYEAGAPVLRGVSIDARPGGITAIAGPSGAGKSTLIALIARFFDPDSGAIRFGSNDLADFELAAWRAMLSIAFQENPLFSASLRDNVAYSRPHATAREIATAIERAGLADFVESLPDGIDTPLGEKGAKLSGGQAQRIGLARALLRDAQILLLDEPTSALDSAAEEKVMRGVRDWVNEAPARLAIILTHRTTTAAHADRTYRITAGKIAEVEDTAVQARA